MRRKRFTAFLALLFSFTQLSPALALRTLSGLEARQTEPELAAALTTAASGMEARKLTALKQLEKATLALLNGQLPEVQTLETDVGRWKTLVQTAPDSRLRSPPGTFVTRIEFRTPPNHWTEYQHPDSDWAAVFRRHYAVVIALLAQGDARTVVNQTRMLSLLEPLFLQSSRPPPVDVPTTPVPAAQLIEWINSSTPKPPQSGLEAVTFQRIRDLEDYFLHVFKDKGETIPRTIYLLSRDGVQEFNQLNPAPTKRDELNTLILSASTDAQQAGFFYIGDDVFIGDYLPLQKVDRVVSEVVSFLQERGSGPDGRDANVDFMVGENRITRWSQDDASSLVPHEIEEEVRRLLDEEVVGKRGGKVSFIQVPGRWIVGTPTGLEATAPLVVRRTMGADIPAELDKILAVVRREPRPPTILPGGLSTDWPARRLPELAADVKADREAAVKAAALLLFPQDGDEWSRDEIDRAILAAQLLAHLGAKESVPALFEFISRSAGVVQSGDETRDAAGDLQAAALWGLARLVAAHPASMTAEIQTIFLNAAQGKNVSERVRRSDVVRVEAIRALGAAGDDSVAEPMLAMIAPALEQSKGSTGDYTATVSRAVLVHLGSLAARTSDTELRRRIREDYLQKLLSAERPLWFASAAQGLVLLADPVALPALEAGLAQIFEPDAATVKRLHQQLSTEETAEAVKLAIVQLRLLNEPEIGGVLVNPDAANDGRHWIIRADRDGRWVEVEKETDPKKRKKRDPVRISVDQLARGVVYLSRAKSGFPQLLSKGSAVDLILAYTQAGLITEVVGGDKDFPSPDGMEAFRLEGTTLHINPPTGGLESSPQRPEVQIFQAAGRIVEALRSTGPVAALGQLFPGLIEEAAKENVPEQVPQALLAAFRSLEADSEKRHLTGSLGQAMMMGLHEFSEDFEPDPYPRTLPGRKTIWTVTTSPTIDIDAKRKLANWADRKGVLVDPGGGGINVAIALARRGVRARPVFFYGGETGELLIRLIRNRGVFVEEGDAIELKGDEQTRVTIIISLDKAGSLVPKGTPVDDAAHRRMVDRLLDPQGGVKAGDIVVISGSLAPGLPESFYADLGRKLIARDAIVVTDTKGPAAREVLFSGSAATTIYSQNNLEFGELVGVDPKDRKALIAKASKILENHPPEGGMREIVITEGAGGAFSVTRGKVLEIPAPKVEPASELGAGDTSLAERVFRAWQGKDHDAGFVYGVAAGTASVLHPGTGGGLQAEVDHFAEDLGLIEETKVKPSPPTAGVEAAGGSLFPASWEQDISRSTPLRAGQWLVGKGDPSLQVRISLVIGDGFGGVWVEGAGQSPPTFYPRANVERSFRVISPPAAADSNPEDAKEPPQSGMEADFGYRRAMKLIRKAVGLHPGLKVEMIALGRIEIPESDPRRIIDLTALVWNPKKPQSNATISIGSVIGQDHSISGYFIEIKPGPDRVIRPDPKLFLSTLREVLASQPAQDIFRNLASAADSWRGTRSNSGLEGLALSGDGTYKALWNTGETSSAILWSKRTEQMEWGEWNRFDVSSPPILDAAFSKDGQPTLLVRLRDWVIIRNVETGQQVDSFTGTLDAEGFLARFGRDFDLEPAGNDLPAAEQSGLEANQVSEVYSKTLSPEEALGLLAEHLQKSPGWIQEVIGRFSMHILPWHFRTAKWREARAGKILAAMELKEGDFVRVQVTEARKPEVLTYRPNESSSYSLSYRLQGIRTLRLEKAAPPVQAVQAASPVLAGGVEAWDSLPNEAVVDDIRLGEFAGVPRFSDISPSTSLSVGQLLAGKRDQSERAQISKVIGDGLRGAWVKQRGAPETYQPRSNLERAFQTISFEAGTGSARRPNETLSTELEATLERAVDFWSDGPSSTLAYDGAAAEIFFVFRFNALQAVPPVAKALPGRVVALVQSGVEERRLGTLLTRLGLLRGVEIRPEAELSQVLARHARDRIVLVDSRQPNWFDRLLGELKTLGILPLGEWKGGMEAVENYLSGEA